MLRAKGLDKRREGNVIMVAPAAEIAEQERQRLEAGRQLEELAPLRSAFLRIKYANAADIPALLQGGGEASDKIVSVALTLSDPFTIEIIFISLCLDALITDAANFN